jgi:hypothetical protein
MEIIALITALLVLIPVVITAINRRKAKRDALGKVESTELGSGMDRIDKLYPPSE